MKAIALFGFLIALSAVSCSIVSNENPDTYTKYLEYLRQRNQIERLRRNFATVCPGKDDELTVAFRKVNECINDIDENVETLCSAVKNHFMRCSAPYMNLFESCLPVESKDAPKLFFSAIDNGIKYLCKSDGEHIFELANTCIFKYDMQFSSCGRRAKARFQQYKTKFPTKSEICELAQYMKPCLLNHLKASCGNTITRESFMGIYDAITLSCQSSVNKVDFNEFNENNNVEEVDQNAVELFK